MPRLTEYVLETALGQVARWRAAGLRSPSRSTSPRATCTPRLRGRGRRAARPARRTARRAPVGDNGTRAAGGPQRAADTLAGLTGHGVKMSLDDFGTGYSSLVHLRRLPVSELKIDRSFVARLAVDNEDAEIVRCTVDLAHSLGLLVVAEGVEDDETWERLRDLGCDAVQGWLVAAAMPPGRPPPGCGRAASAAGGAARTRRSRRRPPSPRRRPPRPRARPPRRPRQTSGSPEAACGRRIGRAHPRRILSPRPGPPAGAGGGKAFRGRGTRRHRIGAGNSQHSP
ncbi:EAL domain-containing protein [Streptomyces sp. M19]